MLTSADAIIWSEKERWTVDETSLLFSGITPDFYTEISRRAESRHCFSEEDFHKNFRIFSDANRNALTFKTVLASLSQDNLSPSEWVSAARDIGLEVPSLIKKSITQADKFKKRKEALTKGLAITKNWKLRVQQEAARRWKTLETAGANPNKHNLTPDLANWCRVSNIKTRFGIFPSEIYIYRHALRDWIPPSKTTK